MIPFVRWLGRRLVCTVRGHNLESARIYHPSARSVVDGFTCERCAHSQLNVYRWQEVSTA